jgi:cysteinyl-tRNA synthetase
MPIKLYDSLTRDFKVLGQREPGTPPISAVHPFAFYNCGPTVYAPAHIGNFRTFVINDVIRRLLELEFGADKVKYVRNITDVDDKTIKRARDEGRPLTEVTKQWTDKFHADCAALNCLPLSKECEPTATGHIREQIDMIAILERKGHAYRAPDGSVYFKVGSFANYGRLSRVKERELKVGSAFAADADEKEDLSDFALWKAHKPDDGDNAWDSPWGRGRPGWHIECSAMSKKHLGETIDLHTGGVDLLFPHHENEIAQSECCNGQLFSRHWYHSEHLLVDGKKMSKSLGNLYTLDQITEKGFSPMALRYALLSGHPRKQLNFTLDSLHAAESALEQLRNLLYEICEQTGKPTVGMLSTFDSLEPDRQTTGSFAAAFDALRNDLNTPTAFGEIFSVRKSKYSFSLTQPRTQAHPVQFAVLAAQDYMALRNILFALGIRLLQERKKADAPVEIKALAERRWAAKQKKDFVTADKLRAELAAAGWSMLDRKDGYSLEPAKK